MQGWMIIVSSSAFCQKLLSLFHVQPWQGCPMTPSYAIKKMPKHAFCRARAALGRLGLARAASSGMHNSNSAWLKWFICFCVNVDGSAGQVSPGSSHAFCCGLRIKHSDPVQTRGGSEVTASLGLLIVRKGGSDSSFCPLSPACTNQ